MIFNYNKTFIDKVNKTTKWYIIDAKKENLGRLSSKVAYILKGKDKQEYLPYQRSKTRIIIINSKHIKVTGKKNTQKVYKRHSGKPGGLKIEVFNKLHNRAPNKIIEYAIKGMLPKNSLGRELFKNLKVYPDDQHPHKAQQPMVLTTK
uniref:Large ribosomal subunit protein uL13c n=1 Tax=Chondria tumulosa TaxID=2740715 RepID=A0A896SUF9_9FLOR|nr:ribosomal protein L13 [Chondria tumulosa]QSD57164.1 ribosomal protein L13 [Chondria tumulosa]